jgi:hypothetical protein
MVRTKGKKRLSGTAGTGSTLAYSSVNWKGCSLFQRLLENYQADMKDAEIKRTIAMKKKELVLKEN